MKVLLADDHALFREGLRAILRKEEDIRGVVDASDGREAVVLAREERPDVIVMGMELRGLNGLDATRAIVSERACARIVGLSDVSDRSRVCATFAAGASAYLRKDATAGELVSAIRTVAQGRRYLSPGIAGDVVAGAVASMAALSKSALSLREREVLQLIAEGKSSKEVATILHVALPTVETHRRNLAAKLELHTIAQLTKYAIREGITTLEH